MLSWGGWYDNYIGPQLGDHAELLRLHPAPETVHLLVGPWDHEGSAEYTDRAVCVQLPPTAEHRWDAYQAFFDRYLLRRRQRLRARRAASRCSRSGATAGSHEPAWPPPAMVRDAALPAGRRRASTFDAPATDEAPDAYRYDPSDPVAETVGRNCWALCTALGDRRRLDGRDDILRYVVRAARRAIWS